MAVEWQSCKFSQSVTNQKIVVILICCELGNYLKLVQQTMECIKGMLTLANKETKCRWVEEK
jgi:hypothetical protein